MHSVKDSAIRVFGKFGFVHPKLLALMDASIWLPAMIIALELRLMDYKFAWNSYRYLFLIILATVFLQLALGLYLGLYRGRYRQTSFDEISGILRVVFITSLFPILLILGTGVAPRVVGFFAAALALLGVFFVRFTIRSLFEYSQRSFHGIPSLIYGAGEVGSSVAQQMIRDKSKVYRPVGFIDDDESKKQLQIMGLKVLGTSKNLESLVAQHGIKIIFIAIVEADSKLLTKLEMFTRENQIKLVVSPSTSQLMDGNISLAQLTELTDEDLIGRRKIKVDDKLIQTLLQGKSVLITGAGGSIGSELSRQVHRYGPSEVFMLDRDETLLHDLQLSLDGKGQLTTEDMVLADIRDRERIFEVISKVKPEVVFHAAALKHLPFLELYPQEAEKTNVQGTKNVLEAALASGVSVFVNISTDKAVRPTSVLGKTKRQAEILTSEIGVKAGSGKNYVSVRFGNVLGSRGSVLGTFRTQIKNGGPLTITDLRVKRFFMTIPEAVHLVLEASARGESGDVMVLDMGESIPVVDIAKKLIEKSGKSIEIQITGLRQGEKIDEELFDNETTIRVNETHGLRIEKVDGRHALSF